MAPRYSVDYKNALIRYLLKVHYEFADPFLPRYWDLVGRTFAYPDATKLTGNDVEELLDDEVQTWQIECENDPKKRRKGHEKGSAYDKLMEEWATVWDSRLLDHWQHVVTKPGQNQGKYESVPLEFRQKVKERVAASEKRKSANGPATKKATPKSTPKKANEPLSQTENHNFEYDGEKLKRVVEAAKSRARQVGKPELADAVHQIYIEALHDMKLRILLEAILTRGADKKQNDEFQEYVRRAKRKIRDENSKGDRSASNMSTPQVQASKTTEKNTSTPQVQASKTTEKSSATKLDRPSAPIDNFTQGSVDSGYASQKDDRVGNDGASGTTGSRSPSEMTEAGKRKRERAASVGADPKQAIADEEHDAKRRKQNNMENGVTTDTNARKKAKFRPAKVSSESGTAEEGSSSELSEADDSDIQAAKRAYDGELERRKSGETLRPGIEVDENTAPPAVAGHQSPGVRASATQPPTPPPELQATAGAANGVPVANMTVARVPSPRPREGLTEAESSHAYRIIGAAAEEAVAPILDRLEGKLDALMSQRPERNSLEDMVTRASSASSSKGKEPATPASQDLTNIADMLQTGDLNLQNPNTTKLISQLARNAAEASIHAAEAARRAGEMARDVSMVLLHLGAKQNSQQTGNGGEREQV